MDPETLIVALRKNAVLVVMHVVLGTIIGLVFGLLTPAQYTSTANANLGVENSEANLPNTFNYLTSIMPTLVEIGTSESTFADVSKTTGISQEPTRSRVTGYPFAASMIATPAYPASLVPTTTGSPLFTSAGEGTLMCSARG